jgi:hypothetical protein
MARSSPTAFSACVSALQQDSTSLIRFAQLSALNTDCPHQDRRKPTEWSSGSTAALRKCCKATIFDQTMSWGRRCTAMYGFTNNQLPQSALGSKTPLQAMKQWHKKQTGIVQETAVLPHGM